MLKDLLGSKSFVVGALIVSFWVVTAFSWPLIVPYDPQAIYASNVFMPPSGSHWFGTDDFGRDVLSRVAAGATTILAIAPIATLLGIMGGVILGAVAGYYGGVADAVITRFIEAALAFPLIIVAVAVLGLLGGSAVNVIIIIAIQFATTVARTIRGAVLVESSKDYVAAAKLLGDPSAYIISVEILPNIISVILVEGTVRLGYAVFVSATLSFLTLGVQQPSPDWGLSIALGRSYLQNAPWMALFPAAALATLVVGVNLMADAIKEVLDE